MNRPRITMIPECAEKAEEWYQKAQTRHESMLNCIAYMKGTYRGNQPKELGQIEQLHRVMYNRLKREIKRFQEEAQAGNR